MKKIIAILSIVLLSPISAFAEEELTCEKDNRVRVPEGKLCCCKVLEKGDPGYNPQKQEIRCKPQDPVDGKCPDMRVTFPPHIAFCPCTFEKSTSMGVQQ